MTLAPATTPLLDVNVIVALMWTNHSHHARARRWFATPRETGWATTPITQSGCVRISSNRSVIPTSTSPSEALAVLRSWTSLPAHEFWVDDLDGVISEAVDAVALRGYRQITDAHLISLAHRRGGRLATFDAKLAGVVRPGFEHLVEVIE